MKAVVIGLVIFVLLALFAGYWVAATDHPVKTAAKPLFTYGQNGRFTYVAALKNNSLYNTTTLTPGNGTLFSAITEWVNVSFTYRFTADRAVNATNTASVSVIVESPAWSKTLFTETVSTSVRQGSLSTLGVVYNLNVSYITGLATAIEKQTGYTPNSYSVVIAPSVHSSVGLDEDATGIAFFPALTLNFTASQIEPSHLTSSSSGAFVPPGSDPTTSARANVSVVAFLLLFGAVGGALAMGYLTWETRHDVPPTRELAAITRPYEEAIVDARAPPGATNVVPVRAWEDIVKAADTLGSPIVRVVRPSVTGPDVPATTSFYVVSGTTAFVFVHGGRAGAEAPLPPEPLPRPGAPVPPKNLTARVRDWNQRYPRIPGVDTSNLESFVVWSDRISDRLRWFRPSSSLRQDSEELLLRAIGLAQRGRIDAAWVVLGQLYARLGPWDTPGKTPASGAAGSPPSDRPGTPPPTKGTGPKS